MRLPFELGCKPSPASMMPALTSSSLYAPMSLISCSVGMAPASLFGVAFTLTMTFIVCSLITRDRDRRSPGSQGDEPHRLGSTSYRRFSVSFSFWASPPLAEAGRHVAAHRVGVEHVVTHRKHRRIGVRRLPIGQIG